MELSLAVQRIACCSVEIRYVQFFRPNYSIFMSIT